MPHDIFTYIIRHSKQQQLFVLLATLAYLPILYLSFELPKLIVNEALDSPAETFPKDLIGFSFNQIEFLLLLCATFLSLVLIAGLFRYYLSVYKGVLGETLLRRLRYDLYKRILEFPLPHLKKLRTGEIITIATAEAEPIGRFMGVAVANPTLLGGTLITALVFLFVQDVLLGLAAIALFPIQAYLVPIIQKRMNAVSRRRLAALRDFAGHVSETVEGAVEVHAHDTSAYELTKASSRLGILFRIRKELYLLGNGIIFLNTFFTQLIPFFFYLIGGYLVITGDLSLGALIAAIAAFREAADPWNQLLEYYQSLEDNRVKYATLMQNFKPDRLRELPPTLRDKLNSPALNLTGNLEIKNLNISEGDETFVEGITFSAPLRSSIAIVGPAASGKSELAQVLSHLRDYSSGEIILGNNKLSELDEITVGRYCAYADASASLFSGSWWDNVTYGLKHNPVEDTNHKPIDIEEFESWQREAISAGNSPHNINALWIDTQDSGQSDIKSLRCEALRILKRVGLQDDIFELGLKAACNEKQNPELAETILRVRQNVHHTLTEQGISEAVERFDKDKFTTNATLAENLLYGRPTDMTFHVDEIGNNDFICDLLKRHDLYDELLRLGYMAARQNVDLFRNFSPNDERLTRFSLIDQNELPEYETLVFEAERAGLQNLSAPEQNRFLRLTFSIAIAHQHMLDLDEEAQARILSARHDLMANLPKELTPKLEFFAENKVNSYISVKCNILHGRMNRSKMQFHDAVHKVIEDEIIKANLQDNITDLGLNASVGTAGARLAQEQKQRLCLARCLLKKPQVLIVNEALSALGAIEQKRFQDIILSELPDRCIIWVDRSTENVDGFDHVLSLRNGKLQTAETRKVDTAQETSKPPLTDKTDLTSVVQLMDETGLFHGISTQTLSLLSYTGERVALEADDELFARGSKPDGIYVVLSGIVDIYAEKDTAPLLKAKSGCVVGELSLLADHPSPVSATAQTHSEVLRLSRDTFFDVMQKDPEFARVILKHISERTIETIEVLRGVDTNEATHRELIASS
ncbi:MAG: ABC transporter transmembrane domain-containing protein [Pseudomonadota bacterium]